MDSRIAKELLFRTVDEFEKRGIPIFLQCGTALGAYRERGFIPYDKDVDLAVKYEEAQSHLVDIAESLNQFGFSVRVRAEPFSRPRVLTVEKEGVHLDVCANPLDGDNRFCPSTYRDYSLVLPARLYDPGTTIEFLGRTFRVPDPIEEYLVRNYGKEWNVPKENDSQSRCQEWGYRPGQGMLVPRRNHTPKHLDEIWAPGGEYNRFEQREYIVGVLGTAAKHIPAKCNILDVGCGTGGLLEHLDHQPYCGIDGSQIVLARARRRWRDRPNTTLELARLESYPWYYANHETFDVLFLGGILFNVVQPRFYVQFINHYRQAFKVKRLVMVNLERSDTTNVQETFHLVEKRSVAVPVDGAPDAVGKRRIEVYDL